jgi:ADP-heptose:LPS heptosyltransferase
LGGGESWGKDAHLKRWSVDKFVKFAQYLLQKKVAEKIVLIGSAGEASLAEEFLKSGLSCENQVGKLSITETAWVIKKSKLFLGNDGGLLHLARAVFKPVIGIYGPADPLVYGPYHQETPGVACNASPGVGSGFSLAIYQAPTDGKPRYHRFRYNANDRSLQDLSVEDAVKMVERVDLF